MMIYTQSKSNRESEFEGRSATRFSQVVLKDIRHFNLSTKSAELLVPRLKDKHCFQSSEIITSYRTRE